MTYFIVQKELRLASAFDMITFTGRNVFSSILNIPRLKCFFFLSADTEKPQEPVIKGSPPRADQLEISMTEPRAETACILAGLGVCSWMH